MESTEDYDCIFRHVFINESSHQIYFGNLNVTFNDQTKLKFLDSAIRTLPRALLDTFRNVELLNLEHQQLENIEPNALTNGKKIRHLFLSYNNIKSLDPGVFDNLNSLVQFAMDGNSLTSIPLELFKNNKNLAVLSLANNNLYRIEDNTFVHNTKLETINVANNQLSHFDLSRIGNLFDADVSNNKLKKLQLPVTIETLDAAQNEIHEVVVQTGYALRSWNPSRNKLNAAGSSQSILRKLILSHNKLNTIDWLEQLKNLEIIDLSHNEIEDISSKDLMHLKELNKLKLNNNRLFTFDMTKNVTKSLKVLDLSYNGLLFVEQNYKQFSFLEELYLDHNNIVSLKFDKNYPWSKLKNLTLSYNDWDCDKMGEFLPKLPTTLSVDYRAESHCDVSTPQGLCCKKVEMAYHDRLISKIAEVTSYEKIARFNGQCNAASLTSSAQNVSTIVTQPGALPSSDLENEVQMLKTEVQKVGQSFKEKEDLVTRNINRIDELTRIYRVPKQGLTLPSTTIEKVLSHLKQRDEFKINETKARFNDKDGKGNELDNIKNEADALDTTLKTKNNLRGNISREIYELTKLVKKLQKDVNKNPNAVHSGK